MIDRVHDFAKRGKKVLICLDSNHTHEHVLAELRAYANLASVESYCCVFDTLIELYDKELTGVFSNTIGCKLLKSISDEIILEFPSSDDSEFVEFYKERGYDKLTDNDWKLANS